MLDSRLPMAALLAWLVLGCGGRQGGSGDTANGGAADDGGPAQVGAESDAAEEGLRGKGLDATVDATPEGAPSTVTDAMVESSANTLPDASNDATFGDAVVGVPADASPARDGSFLAPTALVPNAYNARAIGVDDVNVYFSALSTTNPSGDGIYQVPKNAVGSMPVELSTNDLQPITLVSDSAYVYWSNTLPPEAIRRIIVGGNGATTLAAVNTYGIALNPTTLFWVSSDGVVQSMPKAGGTPTTLGAAPMANSRSIAIDASYIYFASSPSTLSTTINRIPQSGGVVTTLATLKTVGTGVGLLTTDGTNVYFVSGDEVGSVPVTGGAVSVIATGFTGASSLKVDSGHLYASILAGANGPTGSIIRVPVTGGRATLLASAQWSPLEIALDATSIYWTDFDITGVAGAVMVASK